MQVGCFALVDPFSLLDHQLERIAGLGFAYADVTDNSDGACLGTEFGFTALASLDANPFDLKRRFERHGLTITSFCAHANLLDASAPWRYGTAQIVKAVRASAAIGVRHVITTEGDPKTPFGQGLSEREALFTIREKLHEPLRVAATPTRSTTWSTCSRRATRRPSASTSTPATYGSGAATRSRW